MTFVNNANSTATTTINYSTIPAVLQSNIQTALNGLSTLDNAGQSTNNNTLVTVLNPDVVTILFQNGLGGAAQKTMISDGNDLTGGYGSSMTVATTTMGAPSPGTTTVVGTDAVQMVEFPAVPAGISPWLLLQ